MSPSAASLLGAGRAARGIHELGVRGRDHAFLRKHVVLEAGVEARELGLGEGQLALGVERLELDVRVHELEQHGLLVDRLAGVDEDALDASGRDRRDPADAFGNERAAAAHLTQHRAPAHLVDPQRRALDGRRGRAHPA